MTASGNTALIVDDESSICWVLERILAKMHYESTTAQSGREALGLAERNHFAVAFVDAKLPDLEGIDLTIRLRHRQPGMRVVLISGYFYEGDEPVQQWIDKGFICGFIGKPFGVPEVEAAIQAATGVRPAQLSAGSGTPSMRGEWPP